jgi:hypothetical protein
MSSHPAFHKSLLKVLNPEKTKKMLEALEAA